MEFRGDHCWQGVQTNKCLFQKSVRSLSCNNSPPGSRPLLCQFPDLGCIGRCQLTARSFSPGCQVQSELDLPQPMGSLRVLARLSDFTFTFHFHALEKEVATHSSVLAWRIPGMGEPGGLPSEGSHRVGHDRSDLAVAAAVKIQRSNFFLNMLQRHKYLENYL